MSTFSLTATRPVLADSIPGTHVRDAVLIACGAALTIIGAQISIQVPPSPVPITGQTLGVVLAGAALGARRGMASQLLYVLLGLVLPVYADGEQGFDVIWGATGGYLIGFIAAAGVIGALAEHGQRAGRGEGRGRQADPERAPFPHAPDRDGSRGAGAN